MKASFEAHFIKKRNVVFESAKFNLRKQEEGEPWQSSRSTLAIGPVGEKKTFLAVLFGR